MNSTERTRSWRSTLALRVEARSGSGRRGSPSLRGRARRAGRHHDAHGHPRTQPLEVSRRHVEEDTEGHSRRSPTDGLGHGGDGRDARREAAVGKRVGEDRGRVPEAEPAVVDVVEEGVDPEVGEVRKPGHGHPGPQGVAREDLLPLPRVFGDDEDAVLRREEGEGRDRRLELVALGPGPLQGNPFRGAISLGRQAMGGEVLLGLRELGGGPLQRELLLLVVPPRPKLHRKGGVDPGLLEVGLPGEDGLLLPERRPLPLGLEPHELGLGLDRGDPPLLEVGSEARGVEFRDPVSLPDDGPVLLEETELQRPERGLGDEEVRGTDGGDLAGQEERRGGGAPPRGRRGCGPDGRRLPASWKNARGGQQESRRERVPGEVVPFHAPLFYARAARFVASLR